MQKCGPKCPKRSHGCPKNGVSCFREKAFGVLRGATFCKRFVGCPKNGETCFPGKSFWRFKGVQHFANVLSDVPFGTILILKKHSWGFGSVFSVVVVAAVRITFTVT